MRLPPFSTIFNLVLVLLHITLSSAASSTATSFCKCICFNNSTIIALNPPSTSSSPRPALLAREEQKPPTHHKLTCADCNRALCLSYNLPICHDAREEDVFTTCFQRDSLKDEIVVFIFIVATAGLLGWAILKPWVEKLKEKGGFHGAQSHSQTPGRRGRGERAAGSYEPLGRGPDTPGMNT